MVVRYARLTGPRAIEIADRPDPRPGPTQVLVEIDVCGIGGSDRTAYERGFVEAPAWFGHEWTGRIVGLGAEVIGHFEGERVVAGVSAPCGRCGSCVVGRTDTCQSVLAQIVGVDAQAPDHGGFATHSLVDPLRLVPVRDGIDRRDATLIEPAAVAAHAVRRAGLRIGDIVVVVGAGTIGLLTAELARLSGAASVMAVDPSGSRRELACDLGADAAFNRLEDGASQWLADTTQGLGADAVFVCVDTAEALTEGISLVCAGGAVVAVGVGNRIDNLSITALLSREADFRVSLGYSRDDVRRIQSLMQQDRLRVRPLIRAPVVEGLDALAASFEADDPARSGPPKVLVQPL